MKPEEFGSHYRAYLPAITKFLARRVEPEHVEDLCSDLFMKAWQKRDLAPAGFELAWLYSIGGHLIANHRRKQNTTGKLIAALSTPKFAPSAESLAIADLALGEAWKKLKPAEQTLMSLVALDGLTVTEAAQVLGITANAASVRLNRTRTKLAQLLEASE